MRVLLALAVTAAAPAVAQSNRVAFTCTAEASGGGITARTERGLDGRGTLRSGTTSFTLPLKGVAGSLLASWDVRQGLPSVARGRYTLRLPPGLDGMWQLAGLAKPIRARNGLLEVKGDQFRALLANGAPLQVVLVARDGQERGRATLDRAAFDAALDLARQADARALSKSSDLRGQCSRSGGK